MSTLLVQVTQCLVSVSPCTRCLEMRLSGTLGFASSANSILIGAGGREDDNEGMCD